VLSFSCLRQCQYGSYLPILRCQIRRFSLPVLFYFCPCPLLFCTESGSDALVRKEHNVREACGLTLTGVSPPFLTKKEIKEREKERLRKEDDEADFTFYSKIITSCDSAGCWDTSGTRYNSGAGNTHINTQTGRTCRIVESKMHCPWLFFKRYFSSYLANKGDRVLPYPSEYHSLRTCRE